MAKYNNFIYFMLNVVDKLYIDSLVDIDYVHQITHLK